MDIQASKIELAKLILNLDNPSVLKKIEEVIFSNQKDFGATLSTSEKAEIEIALAQLKKGNRTSFESFMENQS